MSSPHPDDQGQGVPCVEHGAETLPSRCQICQYAPDEKGVGEVENGHGALEDIDIGGDAVAGRQVQEDGEISVQGPVNNCRIFPIKAHISH